ncbi:MAG: benzoate-CoA ligase family protein [Labilithrix sp.]|nr:benzoate-CoA ligase family protein [Labilithrix sp.]
MRACDHLPERFNAADWFVGRHVREGRGARTAIVTDAATLTYGELDERARRFVTLLRSAGVRRGDRVAFVLLDGPLLATCFWGAVAAGAVAVPVNTLLKPGDHRTIVDDCDPRVVVVDPSIPGGADLGGPDTLVWTAAEVERALEGGAVAAPGYAETHRDAFAFFLYSSGTTGEPKGVVHLQHDMWICCETYGRSILEITPEDRCFSVAKVFFAYGLGNSLYFPAHVGASSVLAHGRPSPELVFEQVRRHRPTLFFGVPTAYANMLAAIDAGARYDFGSVRRCVSAGEALPASVLERWRERTGLEILDGIGSTEICHIFLSNRAGASRPGSTGAPVEGYDLRLVDERGHDVERGSLGDLLVRGDSTAALYWNKHETTKRTIQGEWIRTGDKYWQDDEGWFFHAGRSDDMIKAGGIWVSPVEVEAALVEHPAVLECAVIGADDADGLAKPHAFVTLRAANADPAGLPDALRAFVKERLAAYKCPRTITILDELPKTATGKIQRFLLRAR